MKYSNPIRIFIQFLLIVIALSLGGCQRSSSPSPVISSGQADPAPDGQASWQYLKVHFINVGQGDCILAESKGHFLLIDAGENDQGQTVVSYLKNAGVSSLDYVIGTHPHSDHIGGLDDVLREFPVGRILLPPVEHTSKTFEDLLDVITDKGMKITMPKAGDTYTLGDASFQILAPVSDYGEDLNNWSVGVRLSYKDNHLVMCGDAEADAEADILKYSKNLSADILKVGHHGSNTSTSDAFLNEVSPSYAVIQCGKDNSYGHPHMETLEKLEKRGIQIFRTDQDGTIVAVCNGSSIAWSIGSANIPEANHEAAPLAEDSNTDSEVSSPLAPIPQGSGSLLNDSAQAYILNTNTKKFHLPTCQSAVTMNSSNRQSITEDRDTLITMGYEPCKQCKP